MNIRSISLFAITSILSIGANAATFHSFTLDGFYGNWRFLPTEDDVSVSGEFYTVVINGEEVFCFDCGQASLTITGLRDLHGSVDDDTTVFIDVNVWAESDTLNETVFISLNENDISMEISGANFSFRYASSGQDCRLWDPVDNYLEIDTNCRGEVTWNTEGADYYLYNTQELMQLHSGVVPVPSAIWLFGNGVLGLIGIAGRRKQVARDM